MKIPIGLFLIILTFFTYSQVLEYEFLNFDDNQYVTENTHITMGFDYKFVIWAFTQSYASNWHPLTWLSHMLDFEIYGLDPLGHHLTNLTFHLSPHAGEVSQYLEKTGMRPINHLSELGVLGSHVLIGHAVHLNDSELETLLHSKTAIASCPWAYLKLGQGVTKFGRHPEFLSKGGRLSLGCDTENAGDNKDLLSTARLFSGLIQEANLKLDKPASHYALELITISGAEALGLKEEIGSLETGKRADVVLIDTSGPSWQPSAPDPVMQLIWGANSSDIDSVVAQGKIIVENKKCKTLDELAPVSYTHLTLPTNREV